MNFLLFNGPPRVGKDTASLAAWDLISDANHGLEYSPIWEKFSFPNKRAFAGQLGTRCDEWGNVDPYESKKGEVVPELGVSYRQWQIDYSEKFMKPLYGSDIFGRLLLSRCEGTPDLFTPIFIVSDCGFQVEVDALRDHNVCLVRLNRKGCDFSGDSREYVEPLAGWSYYVIDNNGPIDQFKREVEVVTKAWLDNHVD